MQTQYILAAVAVIAIIVHPCVDAAKCIHVKVKCAGAYELEVKWTSLDAAEQTKNSVSTTPCGELRGFTQFESPRTMEYVVPKGFSVSLCAMWGRCTGFDNLSEDSSIWCTGTTIIGFDCKKA